MSVYRKLLHRRVPQILGAYAGVGLALVPFVGFLVDRYNLTPHLVDATLVALISLLPSVFLVAYNHGAPGKDPWLTAERFGIPLNLVLATCLVVWVLLGPGQQAEAMTETVVVTDEEGRQTEHIVPKAEYQREIAFFPWTNESGNADHDWLRYGFTRILQRDLGQNRFFNVWTPFSSQSMLFNLRRAGYQDGLGAPVALQRNAAQKAGIPLFVDGRFNHNGEQFTAVLNIYDTDSAELRHEIKASNAEAMPLVDDLAIQLKAALEVQDLEEIARDLDVEEHLTSSPEALQAWINATIAYRIQGDAENAGVLLSKALELDPSFAVAYVELCDIQVFAGKVQAAQASLNEALKHDYRLMESEKFSVRGMGYFLKSQPEKAMAVFEMWTELYPNDLGALYNLAFFYANKTGQAGKAIGVYQRILELNPNEDWPLNKIGLLHATRGEYDQALDHFQRFAENHPDDSAVPRLIARVHRLKGDIGQAREVLERASLVASTPHSLIALADLDVAEGDFEAAEQRLDEAEGMATIASDQYDVLRKRVAYTNRRGQTQRTIELLPRFHETVDQAHDPLNAKAIKAMSMAAHYGLAGRQAEVEDFLAEIEQDFEPPLNHLMDFAHVELYVQTSDTAGLEKYIPRADEGIALIGGPVFRPVIERGRARILELSGDPAGAAKVYETALEQLAGWADNISPAQRSGLLALHAKASLDSDQLEAAEKSLVEALRLEPAHPESNFQMARLHQKNGDTAAAQESLRVALEVWANADAEYRPAVAARALAGELGL